MRTYYKKLFLLLIPACAGFCLALALGSAEQPIELCHLCQNKALVKAAILALREIPYDPNLPEQFDPNYLQHDTCGVWGYDWESSCDGALVFRGDWTTPFEFDHIIAEGDKVSVQVSWEKGGVCDTTVYYFQMATYRIANGKIVESWISVHTPYYVHQM